MPQVAATRHSGAGRRKNCSQIEGVCHKCRSLFLSLSLSTHSLAVYVPVAAAAAAAAAASVAVCVAAAVGVGCCRLAAIAI